MSDRYFLDTNILVYAYDSHEPTKQDRAQSLLLEGMDREAAVVSTQVLGEFFNVVTRRIPQPLTADAAQRIIEHFSIMTVVEIDVPMIHRAIEGHRSYQLSYWDALIVAAAERAACAQILSEDLNEGQSYHGVRVANPF